MSVETMPEEAALLIRRYYAYGGIYTLAASVIWGINTLFLLDAGLSIAEVFIANSAFSVGTVLFEIPTGVVADTVGRRASFLASLVVLAATTLLYVGLAGTGAGVVAFSLVSALMGLGFTFYSGAMEAWLVDGVRFHGYDGDLDQVFSRSQIVSGAAMLIGTVTGGLAGQIDLAIPFVVRSILLILLFGMAFIGMHDIGFESHHVTWRQVPGAAAQVGATGIRFGWRHRSLRLLMVAGAVQGGFFFWAWYAWQPYFLELLERDAVWVAGVVAALLAVSMMIGNGIVELVMRWCGRRSTLFLWTGAVFSVALIGVGVADSFLPALVFLFLGGVAMGVQMPVSQAFVHQVVPSDQRATVVSFGSMISGVGGVVGQTGLGALSDRRGFSAGYIIGGALTLVAIPLAWMVRRQADDADFYAGTSAGAQGACASQGVPFLSHVDGRLPADVS
ncbi:MAG: MFS transporter [Actinomycetota bacterium]|nr:MFS transporter [Actinomycetota bacterium]